MEHTLALAGSGFVGLVIVLGEYPRAVIAAEDEDGLHREKGHIGWHGDDVLPIGRELQCRGISGCGRDLLKCQPVPRYSSPNTALGCTLLLDAATVWFGGAKVTGIPRHI